MSDWYNTVWWPNLQGVISPVWPEVAGKFWQDNSMERFDWVNLLNNAQLTVPWCVVDLTITPSPDDGWSILSFLITAEIFYITSLAVAKAANVTAASYLMSKLIALQAALLTAQTVGTVESDMVFDAKASNPINESFLQAKLDYQAASLTASFVVSLHVQ